MKKSNMKNGKSSPVVDAGASIKFGNTPLHRAAIFGQTKTCADLIEAGADVNARGSFGNAPLHEAANGGHPNVCRLLLGAGADVNAVDLTGNTPLHWGAGSGNHEVCEVLLDAGADPRIKGRCDMAPPPSEGIARLLHGAARALDEIDASQEQK